MNVSKTKLFGAIVVAGAASAFWAIYNLGAQNGVNVTASAMKKICPKEFAIFDKKVKEFEEL